MDNDTDRADQLTETAIAFVKNCDEESNATGWCECAKGIWRNLALPLVQAERHREALWQLLDDIDTLYDACKGDEHSFYEHVKRIHPKRFQHAKSDGYTLFWESMGVIDMSESELAEVGNGGGAD